jgi:hypothetical protein
MRLDQASAGTLSFRQPQRSKALLDAGRLANLGFLLIVLALAGLWLVFPPVELTNSAGSQANMAPQASLAQELPAAGTVPR